MRVLVTGGGGLLGRTLTATAPASVDVHATQRTTPAPYAEAHAVDLADADDTRALLTRIEPDVVVHTAYDKHDGERGIVEATRNIAGACDQLGAGLVHVSSDVVFDGEHSPYAEEAAPAPVHEYGRWKAQAEADVSRHVPGAAIVRCSLIVSTARHPAGDHLDRLLPADGAGLFVDEYRQPIGAVDLARQLWEIAGLDARQRAGVWHCAGPEVLSRYALGLLVAAYRGTGRPVTAARTAQHPGRRPRDLRLLTGRADRNLTARPHSISRLLQPAAPTPVTPMPDT